MIGWLVGWLVEWLVLVLAMPYGIGSDGAVILNFGSYFYEKD
jgi:hypothetical protein